MINSISTANRPKSPRGRTCPIRVERQRPAAHRMGPAGAPRKKTCPPLDEQDFFLRISRQQFRPPAERVIASRKSF